LEVGDKYGGTGASDGGQVGDLKQQRKGTRAPAAKMISKTQGSPALAHPVNQLTKGGGGGKKKLKKSL